MKYNELKDILPIDKLYCFLWEEQMTYKDISEMINCDQHNISKLAKEYSIPVNKKTVLSKCNDYHKVVIDENQLLKHYLEEKMSMRQIAEIFKCNKSVIRQRLKDLGVEIRPFSSKEYYNEKNGRRDHKYSTTINKRNYVCTMEDYIGRKLLKEEVVHHIDFDRSHNNIENLYLFNNGYVHNAYH